MSEELMKNGAGQNESPKIGRQRVIDMLQNSVVPEIVIHGDEFKMQDGSEGLKFKPDLDVRGALYLLDLAGIDYKQLTIMPKGQSVRGSVMVDTGERNFKGQEPDASVFFDHHAKERNENDRFSSATKIVYDLLIDGNMIPESEKQWLGELVRLITQIDDESYSMNRDELKDYWWRSFYGLHNIISFESLVDLIKDGCKANHVFSEGEANDITVIDKQNQRKTLMELCLKQQDYLDKNIKNIERLSAGRNAQDRRQNLDSHGLKKSEKDLGAVLTNIVTDRDMIPLGFTAVRGFNFDSYVKWWEKTGGFFITSRFDLTPVFKKIKEKFPEAKLIRETMIIYKPKEGEAGVAGREKYNPDEFLKLLRLKD